MSSSPTLVCLHGWGFDAGLWEGLGNALPGIPMITLDFGFRGESYLNPTLPEGPLIAVGHSLGFIWFLKNKPFVWQKLIAINSFTRYGAADDFPSGIPVPILKLMIEKCNEDPSTVVADFFQACGYDERPMPTFHRKPLAQGLEWLMEWDVRGELEANDTPFLALAGESDTISPPDLTKASFAQSRNVQIHWHEGGHLLPITAPEWCADKIKDFIKST